MNLSESLRPFIDKKMIAGAVTLVASPDEILSLETIGHADLATLEPMKPDSFFWIASTTKPMTATALMMLVEEGKVALADPVEKFLPLFSERWVETYRNEGVMLLQPAHRPVTVRDLLTHTGGMTHKTSLEKREDQWSLKETEISCSHSPLLFQPGTSFLYGNAGFNTIGRIIEVVTGLSYEAFLQTRLLTPLKMTDTTFRPHALQLQRLAKYYKPNLDKTRLEEKELDQLTLPLESSHRHAFPGGGLFSTALDVARFGQMILKGGTFEGKEYLSKKSVRMMTSTQTAQLHKWAEGAENGYGLGWQTTTRDHGDRDIAMVGPAGHAGAAGSNLFIDPHHQIVMVLMIQASLTSREVAEVRNTFQSKAKQTLKYE